jgi:thiamine kinase-like enzyme
MEIINNRIKKASHSGAGIEVISEGGEIIVEKTFYGKDLRNEAAIKKQIDFSGILTSKYNIQSIGLDVFNKNDCTVVRMPYVEGISGNQVAIHGNRKLANNIRTSLNFYLMSILSKSKEKKIDRLVFINKMEQVKSKPVTKNIISEFNNGCDWVEENCPSVLLIPIGSCHGDLTLSNIIITNDNYMYIFDFLDTFIDSPLQDVSKIIQDMKYGWSFRHERASIKLKGQLFCESAFPDYIDTLMHIYSKELKIFNIMTILRIAPYIQIGDNETSEWFKKTMIQILEE